MLDTPGHEDFSEDTYRTLTAVDSALMVVDGAKGVEDRTIKLMDVCRLRDTPIFSFVNKLDREIRDPIELLDEIESVLKIEAAPINWPIGAGQRFSQHWLSQAARGVDHTLLISYSIIARKFIQCRVRGNLFVAAGLVRLGICNLCQKHTPNLGFHIALAGPRIFGLRSPMH